MREKVEESLASRMEPVWMYSEDKRLSALITAENRKLYPDHPRGLPYMVHFFLDGKYCCELYYGSVEKAHDAMRDYVSTEIIDK